MTTEPSTGTGRGRVAITILSAGATFLAMLDATVVNLAVPELRSAFPSESLSDVTWVITIYAVPLAALLAPAGRLADVVGRRPLYLSGVGLFVMASALCGVAPNLPTLLIGRCVQGIGSAVMIPASLALLLHGTPVTRWTRAIGLWSAATALAAAVGPSVGGLLVTSLDWRAIFYINLPLGGALLLLAARPGTSGPDGAGAKMPDWIGAVLLGLGLGAIVLAVSNAQFWGWGDARTIALIVGGGTVVAVAVRRSVGHPVPALETDLWRNTTFSFSLGASALYGVVMCMWLLTSVLILNQAWHYSVLRTGFAMTPCALAAGLTALLIGRIPSPRMPKFAIAGGALAMAAASIWTWLALAVEPDFLRFWLPCGVVVGLGMGAVVTGTACSVLLSTAPERLAGAIGMNTAARQLGTAFGVALVALILPGRGVAEIGDFDRVLLTAGAVVAVVALLGLVMPVVRPSDAGPALPVTSETLDERA
ncbi:MFS transporter [Streptomyces luteireticuli]|uniref:Major facilitator superfamily (MFS) profile domain-containing protein n=1 Tax=Streptomyces luteireticuli TaxID=173858 RepID=A0ABP3I9T7_9ACTN